MHIKTLHIYSSNFTKQVTFYSEVLGLEITESTENKACFRIGNSLLCIENRPNSTPYHFAINIPSNKEKEALKWLKTRVGILKDGENEIQDFDFWNAKAMYFYDRDKNNVEFIARKNLNNESEKPFDQSQLLEISEIGIPTIDVQREFNLLHKATDIKKKYDGDLERFCAIGDEHGLFICINKQIKKWFPTNDEAYSSDFALDFIVNSARYRAVYQHERLTVLTN